MIALPQPQTSRGIQLQRVIRVAQALQAVRFGLSLQELGEEVNGVTGHPWCARTIRRDVELLEFCGLVRFHDGRARWIGSGGFFEQPATAAGLARDCTCRIPEVA